MAIVQPRHSPCGCKQSAWLRRADIPSHVNLKLAMILPDQKANAVLLLRPASLPISGSPVQSFMNWYEQLACCQESNELLPYKMLANNHAATSTIEAFGQNCISAVCLLSTITTEVFYINAISAPANISILHLLG